VTISGSFYTAIWSDGWTVHGGIGTIGQKDALATFITGTRSATGTTFFSYGEAVLTPDGVPASTVFFSDSTKLGTDLRLGASWGVLTHYESAGFWPVEFHREGPVQMSSTSVTGAPSDGCTSNFDGNLGTEVECTVTQTLRIALIGRF
jgi:hypothetical protein